MGGIARRMKKHCPPRARVFHPSVFAEIQTCRVMISQEDVAARRRARATRPWYEKAEDQGGLNRSDHHPGCSTLIQSSPYPSIPPTAIAVSLIDSSSPGQWVLRSA